MVLRYLWNVLVALDRLANTLLGGEYDMTISGRMGLHLIRGTCKLCGPLCRFLDLFQLDHCIKQAREERERI